MSKLYNQNSALEVDLESDNGRDANSDQIEEEILKSILKAALLQNKLLESFRSGVKELATIGDMITELEASITKIEELWRKVLHKEMDIKNLSKYITLYEENLLFIKPRKFKNDASSSSDLLSKRLSVGYIKTCSNPSIIVKLIDVDFY